MAAVRVSLDPQSVLAEMDRIEAAALREASVLEILNLGSAATTIKHVKEAYKELAYRIHPHKGGNFVLERATCVLTIVTRAWEQAMHAAEFDLLDKRGCYQEPFFDPDFVVPGILWYSMNDSDEEREFLKAQKEAEEAKILKGQEAAAATAAPAAADGGAGGASADEGDSDDDDDDEEEKEDLAALYVPAAPIPTPVFVDEQYPAFNGVPNSPEHRAYILASKAYYRNQQLRRSKATATVVAKNRLRAARLGGQHRDVAGGRERDEPGLG